MARPCACHERSQPIGVLPQGVNHGVAAAHSSVAPRLSIRQIAGAYHILHTRGAKSVCEALLDPVYGGWGLTSAAGCMDGGAAASCQQRLCSSRNSSRAEPRMRLRRAQAAPPVSSGGTTLAHWSSAGRCAAQAHRPQVAQLSSTLPGAAAKHREYAALPGQHRAAARKGGVAPGSMAMKPTTQNHQPSRCSVAQITTRFNFSFFFAACFCISRSFLICGEHAGQSASGLVQIGLVGSRLFFRPDALAVVPVLDAAG